ncbi:MAG: recombinase RecJ [Lachnospiraceae bacterium]|jgi:phosphoglycolate phosphatase|nr:recombinase RecJ [Lachnospiraceae bacterium]
MHLRDLTEFENITIQCHDNPDADAIASGYGLYLYFKKQGKNVSLIYSGAFQIQKANIVMMTERLQIPITYRKPEEEKIEGLLITVDCQYRAGNVTRFEADEVAVIDHHFAEIEQDERCLIQPNLGSCATLVWQLLQEENFEIQAYPNLNTALFYGLFMDTYQFSELFNPFDMDMRDQLSYDRNLITLLKGSNLSVAEMKITGEAILNGVFDDRHHCAIIKAEPCDPNILGLISDFMLQVDGVNSCVVYNEMIGGYKLSVRSCEKETKASGLAMYLTEGIGSGGGHYEKAGGFINQALFVEKYGNISSEVYIEKRLRQYFDTIPIIYAGREEIDISDMEPYIMGNIPSGFVRTEDIWPVGTNFKIRTIKGDIAVASDADTYVIIGPQGEVYPIGKEHFEKKYRILEEPYIFETSYPPVARIQKESESKQLMDLAKKCETIGKKKIYAKKLLSPVKVFGIYNGQEYMLGNRCDYLAVNADNRKDVFVVTKKRFQETCYSESIHEMLVISDQIAGR